MLDTWAGRLLTPRRRRLTGLSNVVLVRTLQLWDYNFCPFAFCKGLALLLSVSLSLSDPSCLVFRAFYHSLPLALACKCRQDQT